MEEKTKEVVLVTLWFHGKKHEEGASGTLFGANKHLDMIFRHLIFAVLGALVGSAELVFGIRPFGVALAAAASEYVPAVAVGILVYSLIVREYVAPIILCIVIMVRLLVGYFTTRRDKGFLPFTERVGYRLLAGACVMLGAGIYRLFAGDFRYYDLFGVLLAVAATPLASFLYVGLFEEKERAFPFAREAGLAALVLTVIFAIKDFSVFGIYPAAVLIACAALLLAAHRGWAFGAIGGLLGGCSFDLKMAPAFFLLAVMFSLLEKSSRGGGVLGGGAVACAYAFLLQKNDGLLYLLPSLLTAGALFLAFDSAGLIEGAPARRLLLARRRAAKQSANAAALRATEAHLMELSGALCDLSGTFYEVGSRLRRPGKNDLHHLCDKAFDEVCPACRHREVCWGSEYQDTATSVKDLAARLYTHGAASKEALSSKLQKRCGELPRVLATINNGAAALAEEALRGDKTSVVAMDYAAAGRAISEIIESAKEDFEPVGALGDRICERLERQGYVVESAVVCGKTSKRVILRGLRLPGRSIKMREVREIVERICRFSLGDPTVEQHDGLHDIIFGERVTLGASFVKLTRPKGKGEGSHCGDSVTTVSVSNGVEYALICDGMGSGNGAALTSALATLFLTRLLQAGGRADSSLRMLNGFMAARGRREAESSTTVDLLRIDRVSGAATLYKCGAAPTYLLRRGEVTRFSSHTAPVGILESLDAERLSFEVEAGDVLVQISDGFTGGEEECLWLADMLRNKWDGDAEAFARMALNRATKEHADDLSLIITTVTAAKAEGEQAAA